MTLDEYSTQASATATENHAFGDITPAFMETALGLLGEGGEFAEKLKKLIRDKQGRLTEEDKIELAKELGDVLWYVNQCSVQLGLTLEQTAKMNLDKVLSRTARGVRHGSGDNR